MVFSFPTTQKWYPISGVPEEQKSLEPHITQTALEGSDVSSPVSNLSVEDLEKQWAPSSPPAKKESYKIDPRVISDAIIGLSDGLTVPFALTAGLSAIGDTKVVIYGGLAELVAGAISMGLGGYLGAKSEQESYKATESKTRDLIKTTPDAVDDMISTIFEPYNLPSSTVENLAMHLADSSKLLDFLMHFEHELPEPAGSRAITCAITIASGYFIGGFIPLFPYFFVHTNQVTLGLVWSIGVMILALFAFGYSKTCFISGWSGRRNVLQGMYGGGQMVIVGSVAAGAAMGLVKAFNHLSPAF